MGCSIGGRIVLHLALEHAPRFRALIGLESGAHAEPYYDLDWLHRPDVHGGEMCGAMISGLIAPTAPEADRWETIWHYMQGGPGVFKGDLHFYTADGDESLRKAEARTAELQGELWAAIRGPGLAQPTPVMALPTSAARSAAWSFRR
jgi:pimeloyl-ACP methyl ester carboxylesterase